MKIKYLGGVCSQCGKRYSDIKSKRDQRKIRCASCGSPVELKTEWVLLPVYSLETLAEHAESGEPIETLDGTKIQLLPEDQTKGRKIDRNRRHGFTG